MKTCSIEGCGKIHKARGWCVKHYQRWKNHGDPLELTRTEPGEPERFINEIALAHMSDECLIWPYSRNPAGYGKISVNGKLEHTNRVVCERAHGPAPSVDHEAAHSCGKGHTGCIAPLHLSWKTHVENQHDKIKHGTDNRGEKHPMARLSEHQVREIFEMKGTATQQAIAEIYGVDRRHVGLIHRGKTWRSLDLRTGAHQAKAHAGQVAA